VASRILGHGPSGTMRRVDLTVPHEFGPSFLRPGQVSEQFDLDVVQDPVLQQFLRNCRYRLPFAFDESQGLPSERCPCSWRELEQVCDLFFIAASHAFG